MFFKSKTLAVYRKKSVYGYLLVTQKKTAVRDHTKLPCMAKTLCMTKSVVTQLSFSVHDQLLVTQLKSAVRDHTKLPCMEKRNLRDHINQLWMYHEGLEMAWRLIYAYHSEG